MTLYKIHCDGIPELYFKAKTKAEVKKKFKVGLSAANFRKYINDPTFAIHEVTWEDFLSSVPDEFQISEDTSF